MFPGTKPRTYYPVKLVKKQAGSNGHANDNVNGEDEDPYEEDPNSEEGAVYPIQNGRIVNALCLMAFLKHIYSSISPTFNTPILIVTQPAFTDFEYELLTRFCFEIFTPPAFTLVDAARAAQWAYGPEHCVVIDVGFSKTDVTAFQNHEIEHIGRVVSLADTGGEAMTQRLLELLGPKGFSRNMCEQLKKSGICEILPMNVPLPSEKGSSDKTTHSTATGSSASASGQRGSISGQGGAHAGGAVGAKNDDEGHDKEENEGVLDVAGIVASDRSGDFAKTKELLAKKEREKAEKAASKKAAADAAAAPKQSKMQNAQRAKATFHCDMSAAEAAAHAAALQASGSNQTSPTEASASHMANKSKAREGHEPGTVRKTIEVGVERFQAADNGILDRIAEAVHRVINAADPILRSELWNNLIIVGNGTRVKGTIWPPNTNQHITNIPPGFKEALLETIIAKYLISPSSATIFTSELPSNISTPLATGANTPNPLAHATNHPGVNPMLLAATTASNAGLAPPPSSLNAPQQPQQQQQRLGPHSGHGQTPTSIKLAKSPDYFSEFKDGNMEEIMFAGAQMLVHLVYVSPGSAAGSEPLFMSRPEYNANGPKAIRANSLL